MAADYQTGQVCSPLVLREIYESRRCHQKNHDTQRRRCHGRHDLAGGRCGGYGHGQRGPGGRRDALARRRKIIRCGAQRLGGWIGSARSLRSSASAWRFDASQAPEDAAPRCRPKHQDGSYTCRRAPASNPSKPSRPGPSRELLFNTVRSSLEGVQAQHQCHRMLGRLLKTIVRVKLFRTVMKGVYEQRPDTGVLRNGYRTANGVLQ